MFNQSTSGYSLADIAAATGANRYGSSGGFGDFGGNGAWWLIVLFLFCFAGWGGNGFMGGGNGGGPSNQITYGLDMSGLREGQSDIARDSAAGFYGINNSLLTSQAAMTSAITSGINDVRHDLCDAQLASCQNTNTITNGLVSSTYALQNQLNTMAASQAQCCCDVRNDIASSFADLRYNLATEACDTRRATQDAARDIVDNQNANTRQILDFLVQDRITALTNENQALRTQISQENQNEYLLSQLRPNAMPAYLVANPYTGYGYPYYYNGLMGGTGCGCSASL